MSGMMVRSGPASSYPASARILINGEPRAAFRGTVTLIGARPGVDGRYYIAAAEHNYSRQGYVTTLDFDMPNLS
jgi:uncharacterized protein